MLDWLTDNVRDIIVSGITTIGVIFAALLGGSKYQSYVKEQARKQAGASVEEHAKVLFGALHDQQAAHNASQAQEIARLDSLTKECRGHHEECERALSTERIDRIRQVTALEQRIIALEQEAP